MYQDNRETLVPIPPYDCKPFQNYPENPDWLYFFSEWEKIKNSVGDLPALLPDIEKNTAQRIIFVNERGQYLKHMNQKPLVQTPADRPVEVDNHGKLWYKPEPSGVFSVNGHVGHVEITTESIGAMPADTPIPPPYELPTATDTRLGGVRAIPKTDAMTDEVGIDEFGHLFVEPSSGPLPPEYKLPVASVTTLGGVKAEEKTDAYSEPVAVDKQGKLFVKPSTPPEKKEVDVYDYPPMPIPEGIQLFVDESEDPVPIKVPTKVSELENDSEFEKSQTIKVDTQLAGVTDIETLRTFLYNQRKAVQRKAQFEVSPGGPNVYLMDILGYPAGATAEDRAFLYIELPFSEAGGYQIRYTYQLRDKEGIWERIDNSTLNYNWKSTGWMDKVDCMSKQEAVETFCPPFEVTAPVVTCNPVTIGEYAYPISVKSQVVPKQEGSGDPRPSNVRPIVATDKVLLTQEAEGKAKTYTAQLPPDTYGGEMDWEKKEATIKPVTTVEVVGGTWAKPNPPQWEKCRYTECRFIDFVSKEPNPVFSEIAIHCSDQATAFDYVAENQNGAATYMIGGREFRIVVSAETASKMTPSEVMALGKTFAYTRVTNNVPILTPGTPTAIPGVNTLYSDTGDTTVSGREDPTATLDSLAKRVSALENKTVPQQMYPATIAPEGVEDTPTIIPEIGVDKNGST